MTAKEIEVSVAYGSDMEPVIHISDPDQIKESLLKMNLEAAHKLLEDLTISIEMVESLMPGQDDVTH